MPNYKMENDKHRGFHIRATSQHGKTHGRVFHGGKMIGKLEAADMEEALRLSREWVDSHLAQRAAERSGQAPEPSEYIAAFKSLGKKVSEKHKTLLREHYKSPERSITATQLAAAGGWTNSATANLHYGRLGGLVQDFVQMDLLRRDDGTPVAASALATGDGLSPEDPTFRWIMRPEVAAALEQLGWVDKG